MSPLAGIKVVDFSTLLPGPLASLILAEAGAEVVKVERPGRRRAARLRAAVRRGERRLCPAQSRQAQHRARPQGERRARAPDAAAPLRGRADRAVPPGRDGAPRARPCGARGGQPAPDLLLDHRLRPERAQGAGRGARSELSRRDRPAAPGRRRGRRAGDPARPDRGHRGRQLSGRAQHPARAARARRERRAAAISTSR